MMKRFTRLLSIATLAAGALFASSAQAATGFEACPQFFAAGHVPNFAIGSDWKLRALCYDAFAVLHSGKSRTPLFVAERLNRAQLDDARNEERTNKFFADARLPSAERAELDDYRGSGLDRGHMSPAADQPTAQAMAQSFSLANMVPQAPENNRKSWADIEKATRKYARRATGDVYVVSGPVFSAQPRTIGSNRVWVPTSLFKLVYDAQTNRAWAHWIDNTDEARPGAPISYEELTRRLGVELLPGIHPRG
jgi:endonuclease G